MQGIYFTEVHCCSFGVSPALTEEESITVTVTTGSRKPTRVRSSGSSRWQCMRVFTYPLNTFLKLLDQGPFCGPLVAPILNFV